MRARSRRRFVGSGGQAAVGHRTAPTAPSNLRITAGTATSISLAWNASTDNSTNWWYCVQVDGAGCYRVDPPRTTFTHPKLAPNRTTTWTVVALDAAGNRSGSSNSVTFTTPADTTAPSPAPVLSTTAVHPARISVAWTAAADNTSQVWYTLFVDGQPHGADLIGYRADTALHLAPGSTHVFRVSARDANGNTVQSETLSVTTPTTTDTVPPSPPANFRFSSETSPPEAWLDWDRSADDRDSPSQILYEVFVNGQLAGESTTIGSASTIAYCRTEGPNTFVVRATDTSGNTSAPSNQITLAC